MQGAATQAMCDIVEDPARSAPQGGRLANI
jgi:hypothetical protein